MTPVVDEPLSLLEALFRNAPLGFALIDRESRFLRVNEALATTNGIPSSDHVGKKVSEVVPQLWSRVEPLHRRALGGELILNESIRGVSNTGEDCQWLTSYYPVRVAGDIIAIGLVINDTSARVRVDEALRRRSDLYGMLAQTNRAVGRCRSSTDLFQEVCAIAVETGRFRFAWVGVVNGTEFRVVASAGDAAGYLQFSSFSLHEADVHSTGPIGRSLRSGEPVVVNDFLGSAMMAPWHDAGRRAGVAASAGFPLAERGKHVAVLNLYAGERDFFTDELVESLLEVARSLSFALDAFAGERTRMNDEAALRMRDRAIQAVSQGIVITDPHRFDNPITFVSPGFEAMTGYTADEVIGKNGRFLQGPGTDRATSARLSEAVRAGRSCQADLLNYRKDGTTFWNHLTVSPVHGPNGELTHFVGIQSDITEQRQLESQLRQAQKMEAVGRLAAGIAHDFNNVLCVILGYSSLALAQLPSGEPLRAGLEEISRAAERATDLTRQLLAFSRQQSLRRRVIDVNQVISGMEKMIQRVLTAEVELSVRSTASLGHANVDPGQVEQVLMNLAVNARDAMPQGGRVTIETADIDLPEPSSANRDGVVSGPFVVISFTDTGTGMDSATRERIFEPFFTTKEVGKGTGLGLSVVFGIVQQSGGHISVESEVEKGTTFRIYLPRTGADVAKDSEVPHPMLSVGGNETILLVEDSPQVRAMMRTILVRYGYTVLDAENAGEAFLLCEKHETEIHLLLTDVVMPRMSGRQLAQRLCVMRPDMKVLFMSGYADPKYAGPVEGDARSLFMQKPITADGLLQNVRRALDRGPAGSAGAFQI